MVSFLSQTSTLIALNFNRTFWKNKLFVFSLVLLFALSWLNFYLGAMNRVKPSNDESSLVNISLNSSRSSFFSNSIFYNVSALGQQDQQKLLPFFNSIEAEPVPFSAQDNSRRYDATIVVFTTPRSYTLKDISSFAINDLNYCISSRSPCRFNSANMQKLALLKLQIDGALTSTNTSRIVLNRKVTASSSSRIILENFYNSFFFIAVGRPFINALLEDRAKGIKFGLFMTGIRRPAYYIGLFLLPIMIAIAYSVAIIYMTMSIVPGALVSTVLVPFTILFFCTAFSYLGVFWLISQFVSTERNASIFVLVYSLIGIIAATPLMQDMLVALPPFVLILLCINPGFALSSFIVIANFSPFGPGFSDQSVPYGAPSVNQFIMTALIVTLLIISLAIYMDWLQVSQDERRSFFYPIYALFNHPSSSVKIVDERNGREALIEPSVVDHLPEHDKIVISNLSKKYDGSSVFALSNVSLEFAKGEIFGLLGYNGAGKSTLINILCGVLSPSGGSIRVFGRDPSADRQSVAIRTGICQQQDILFDKLTTREHLYYFGLMRGVPKSSIQAAIESIKEELQIDDAMMGSAVSVLSGGQKRKLCVALAYINDPELVILDEMSSGVDPENRRVIWDFLMRKREGRATLLCTHFMDEADIVTGRKAMLTLGRVVCLGSSTFLKNEYDTGYTLSLEKSSYFNMEKLENWLRFKQVNGFVSRSTPKLVEYVFSAHQIGFLQEFENDERMRRMYLNYSIKENGLQEIFSSRKLIDEHELQISPEHQQKILKHFSQFNDPSMSSKTFYLMQFELKRAISTLSQLFLRSVILGIVTGLCCYFLLTFNSAKNGSTVDIVIDSAFFNRFIPSGFQFTTNVQSLIQRNPGQFSSVIDGGLGSVIQQGDGITNVTLSAGFAGNGFLAVKDLFPNMADDIETTYQFVPVESISPINFGTIPIILILFAEAMIYLAVIMTDEVAESRAQLKYLLLSFGIPLASYWLVMILKLIVISLPFTIALAACIPRNFLLFDSFFAFAMAFQMIALSALLGSALSLKTARGVVNGFLYGIGVYITLATLIIVSLKLPSSTFGAFGTASYFIGPFVPIAPFFQILSLNINPSKSVLILAALGNMLVFISVLVLVELRHLFIRNVRPVAKSAYVQVTNIRKSFTSGFFRRTTKVAVNDLNLSIPKNELFALLGPNGSGKTTTLSMITAQQLPESGHIHMDNIHVASKSLDVIKKIGYCPQFDDLLVASMTVSEHLILFCTMNGISPTVRDEYISLLLQAFGIERFYGVKCGALSGGTKRKVSAALAVMLPRSLVVLDEASTGLDPLARLKLWNTVKLLNRNRTTIMTTHYINETSACDRIAIMTAGNLRCCDTEHELAKQIEGYELTIKSQNLNPHQFLQFAQDHLFFDDRSARVSVESMVGDTLVVHLRQFSLPVGLLVSRLIAAKLQFPIIQDFQLSRMSLEHVFLKVAKENRITPL